MINFLRPRPTLSEDEIKTGLRWLTWEGTVSMGFDTITTSGVLVAFALALGANNFQIGILAAIPFIMQILQIPAVWLVDKFRRRKIIVLLSWFPAQLLWLPIALIPFFLAAPSNAAISLLLALITFRGLLHSITSSAWNAWIRDLVPESVLGKFFSRRLAFATFSGIVFSLSTAFFINYWLTHTPSGDAIFGYTWALLLGAIFLGLSSPVFMALMPEPLMQPLTSHQPPIWQRLTAPIQDHNFRRLLLFLIAWGFASNMAIPFFAVHMLQRLGLSVSWVIALSVLSQIFYILFVRFWGNFADRFGNKSVLSIGVSLYLLIFLGWIFTTMPEKYFLTVPLLILLHVFAGIASAAVTLTISTIGLKLAPQDEATSYLVGASVATSLGAGLGPLFSGLLADYFYIRQLNLTFTWIDATHIINLPALSIIGRDFVFGIASILCFIILGILPLIKEKGEESREIILESLVSPMRDYSRTMNPIRGFTLLNNSPFELIKRIPVPGLDMALGVTAYQIAEMARVATLAAVKGRRVTKKLEAELKSNMKSIRKSRRNFKKYGEEITRSMARGAMHVMDDKIIGVKQLTRRVTKEILSSSIQSGGKPKDSILGMSKGIVQGASEVEVDLSEVVSNTMGIVKETAKQIGLSEEEAINVAVEGVLQVAETLDPESAAEIVDELSDENLLQEQTD
ncbi:MFS transporter [Chloroflexota bacterium]